MLPKEKVDSYLENNGWTKFVDDDDVDFFQSRDGQVNIVYPEDSLLENNASEYERLKNEALADIAKYEGMTVAELVKAIQ